MKQDLLTCLPPELTIDILSRLPSRSIIRCKCVCKPWRDLIKSNEFVNSHLSKSVPGLALFERNILESRPNPYKFLEFVENSMHTVFNLSFPHDYQHIHSSVNGLLFLLNLNRWPCNIYICNPITRDYVKLPCPHEYPSKFKFLVHTFGFGVSKKSHQYKVVRLFYESDHVWKIDEIDETKCQVYTLGTGLWRSIEPNIPLRYDCDNNTAATFLNGNLHWQGPVLHDGSMWISCFDLETELFTIFSAPPIHGGCPYSSLSVLDECLVFCDNSYDCDERKEIVIWFMNEYGDDKSWTKKFDITKSSPAVYFMGPFWPIKVFEDGDILIAQGRGYFRILCYFSKTKTIEKTDFTESYGFDRMGIVSYTPSFVPLNTFKLKNVRNLSSPKALLLFILWDLFGLSKFSKMVTF